MKQYATTVPVRARAVCGAQVGLVWVDALESFFLMVERQGLVITYKRQIFVQDHTEIHIFSFYL